MEQLLSEYGPALGYIILLIGSFVEGETVVLTAGFLSYKGYLSLTWIIIISFLGSLIADQLLFYIGRYYGPGLIERKPALKEKSKRIFDLLHRYNVGFILSFRFIYGIRVASPLVIGASGISIKRFTILNLIAAIIWATISCIAGYMIGYWFADAVDAIIAKIIKFEKMLIIGVGILVLLAFIGYKIRGYFVRKKSKIND
ncbi:MAG: DedA family protein [Candidatus Nucleicultricaceae bacterium]